MAAYGYELGTAFFETCTYFQFNILEQNIASLLYAAKVARTPYLTPAGPESLSVAVPPRAVAPGDLVAVSATLDDTRYSTLNGTEPSQAIAAAQLYVDVPPSATGAAPLAMSATDGLFDETGGRRDSDPRHHRASPSAATRSTSAAWTRRATRAR